MKRLIFIASIILAFSSWSCRQGNKFDPEFERGKYVFDNHDFLTPDEEALLNSYLDSLMIKKGFKLVYQSDVDNEMLGVDSLAEKAFQEHWLAENKGALVYLLLAQGRTNLLSVSKRWSKIVVSKEINAQISNDRLTQITNEMNSFFKRDELHAGLRDGFSKLDAELKGN